MMIRMLIKRPICRVPLLFLCPFWYELHFLHAGGVWKICQCLFDKWLDSWSSFPLQVCRPFSVIFGSLSGFSGILYFNGYKVDKSEVKRKTDSIVGIYNLYELLKSAGQCTFGQLISTLQNYYHIHQISTCFFKVWQLPESDFHTSQLEDL